jgi:hypothetical protein
MHASKKSEGPRAATPGPSQPTAPKEQKGSTTMMTQNIDIGLQPIKGDRYERLIQSVEILAADESVSLGELPYNGEGLRAFAATIRDLDLLGRLSEYDANTVSLLAAIDFLGGAERMAWRLHDLLSDGPRSTPERQHDDEFGVIHAFAGVLHMLLGAFIEPNPKARLRGLLLEMDDAHGDLRDAAANAEGDRRLSDAAENLLTAIAAMHDAIEAL